MPTVRPGSRPAERQRRIVGSDRPTRSATAATPIDAREREGLEGTAGVTQSGAAGSTRTQAFGSANTQTLSPLVGRLAPTAGARPTCHAVNAEIDVAAVRVAPQSSEMGTEWPKCSLVTRAPIETMQET